MLGGLLPYTVGSPESVNMVGAVPALLATLAPVMGSNSSAAGADSARKPRQLAGKEPKPQNQMRAVPNFTGALGLFGWPRTCIPCSRPAAFGGVGEAWDAKTSSGLHVTQGQSGPPIPM